MKRPGSAVITGILAFVFASFASLLVYNYLQKYANKPFQGIAVVSAATDVPIGTKLGATHVRMTTWPKENVPSGTCTDATAILGRVAVRQLSAGDIVTEQKLMPQNVPVNSSIMTYIVPQGHRAVTVAVNEVAGVAGFITPNSRVDIVLTSALPGNKEDNMSKVILQNIPVLATGQVTEQKDGKPAVVPTVTLDLAPDDAEKLIVGANAKKGSLQLLLRNVIDIAAVDTRGATITNVLGRREQHGALAGRTAPKVVKQVATLTPVQPKQFVEIIKGGTKSTREFSADQ